jgi:prepilin-type N-terminal cleavage/methylation domain-containing protein
MTRLHSRAARGQGAGLTLIEVMIAVTIISTLTAWVVGATRDMGRITEANALDVRLAREGREALTRLRADLQRAGIRRVDMEGLQDDDPADDLHFPHVYYDGVPGRARRAGGREGLDAPAFQSRGHEHAPAPILGEEAYATALGLEPGETLRQASLILALPADQDLDGRPDMDVLGPGGTAGPDGIPELDCNGDGRLSQATSDLVHPDTFKGLDEQRVAIDPLTRLVWSRNEVAWIVREGQGGQRELVRRTRDLRVAPGNPEYPFRVEVVARDIDWFDIKYAEDLQFWDRPEDPGGDSNPSGADALVPANALVVTLWMRGLDRQGHPHHFRTEAIVRLPLGEQRFPEAD